MRLLRAVANRWRCRREPRCPACGSRHPDRGYRGRFACAKNQGGSFRGVKREN